MAHLDNLIEFWDLTANANGGSGAVNLTNNGTVTFSSSGATFNGTSQYLTSASSLLNGKSTCTISFWAKYAGSGGNHPCSEGVASSAGSFFYEGGDSGVGPRLFFWGASANQDTAPTLTFSSGAHHHYVIVRTSTAIKTYKDGSIVDNFSPGTGGNIQDQNSGSSLFTIGRVQSGTGSGIHYWNGDIKAFELYSDDKSAVSNWITDTFNSNTTKFYADWAGGGGSTMAAVRYYQHHGGLLLGA